MIISYKTARSYLVEVKIVLAEESKTGSLQSKEKRQIFSNFSLFCSISNSYSNSKHMDLCPLGPSYLGHQKRRFLPGIQSVHPENQKLLGTVQNCTYVLHI